MAQFDPQYLNSDLKPSEITEMPWLYELNDELQKKYASGKDCGKWMMFFPNHEIDQKWAFARNVYKYAFFDFTIF